MSRFHKLLRIDLNTSTYHIENINQKDEEMFLGGKGLGTAFLVRELAAGIDPLGPENKMIIAAGPLTGTSAPASSRFEIVTKSPLTGLYLDCSSGGHFGQELKATGFDLVIIEGVSKDPVVLYIHNDTVAFLDASSIWGKEVYETESSVRNMIGDPEVRVMSIGPAGENLVKFACLSNDYSRNAARGGSGAVLGSKNVKAIAVRGSRDITVHDYATFKETVSRAKEVIFNNPWVPDQRKYGTPRSVAPVNENGLLPVNNFRKGTLPSVAEIDELAFEKVTVKRLSCGECPVACSKGYGRGTISLEGPEYETIGLFGPNIGILDPHKIAEFNYYCNQYGLDTITAGSLIGAVLETGKYPISDNGGTAEAVLELLHNITFRQGIGDLLAEGPRPAGAQLGISYSMPEIKGMGFPAYDPRCSPGTALVYMTADRGACHLRSWPLGRELSGVWESDDLDGRVEFVKNQQDEKAAEESLTVCQFPYGIGLLDEILAEMLNAATGEDWTLETMKRAGERIWNLSRIFNVREGLSRKDDYLPEKFSKEGIEDGPLQGQTISVERQDYMLDRYYEYRGWTADGIPTAHTLERLGIKEML